MRNRRIFLVLAIGLAAPQPALASLSISKKATTNVSCAAGVCTATAKNAVLNVSDLAGMLASGDVTVQSVSIAQDIAIDAGLTWASMSRLTLDSYRSITFNRPVTVAGTGALTITTNDGGSGGDYAFVGKGHVEFWDTASKLTINSTSYFLVGSMRDLAHYGGNKHIFNIALMRSIHAGRKTYIAAPIDDFHGSLEGLGNAVDDLTINDNLDRAMLGLMSIYSPESPFTDSIRDIRLENFQITATGSETKAGALVGQSFGRIHNVHVTGSISLAGATSEAGGVVGDAVGLASLQGCGSSVLVSIGENGSAGGLVGTQEQSSASIDHSFATGSVSGGGDSKIGGLVGDNIGGPIINDYATGAVSGASGSKVGGLVGANDEGGENPKISTSYSTGTVTGGVGASVGGSIGTDVAVSSISDLYWDLDTSGISDPSQGAGNIPNDHGITGVTDAQLKSGLPSGFDPAIWAQNPSINNGYPYLLANPPQ